MKKILTVFISVILLVITLIPAFSVEYGRLFADTAGLVDEINAESVEEKLEAVSEKYGTNIVIVTTDNLEGKTDVEYADDYFDYNGYGEDGVLLLIYYKENNEGNNRIYISTKGTGIEAFDDVDIEYCLDIIYNDISESGFFDACISFCECCDMEYNALVNGENDSEFKDEAYVKPANSFKDTVKRLAICAVIGLVVALIVTSSMASKLKTVRSQTNAANYENPGSMNITAANDTFLYLNVVRRAKPKENHSGGTSTHTSSSGSTHGGGGRSF